MTQGTRGRLCRRKPAARPCARSLLPTPTKGGAGGRRRSREIASRVAGRGRADSDVTIRIAAEG
jgi:hypothetical protein